MTKRKYDLLAGALNGAILTIGLAAAMLSFAVVYRAGYDAATAKLTASVPQNSCRASGCCFQAEK